LLVIEDLAMAVYLPCVAVMLAGDDLGTAAIAVAIALGAAAAVFVVAVRLGPQVSRALDAPSDEGLLLGVLGLTLLVAGVAQLVEVSAAIGAFLVGIAISGPVQRRASSLVEPLRDLFAAIFFILFGFRIDPADLPRVLAPAAVLALVTAATKVLLGWLAARRRNVGSAGRVRAGSALIARGEFSIVIAGLAIGTMVEPDLVPLAAAYVLILAIFGPVVTRFADDIHRTWVNRGRS
jgi:CPA2 family monovalent cation:H+ antiporter-2